MKALLNQSIDWEDESYRYASNPASQDFNNPVFKKYNSFFSNKRIKNLLDVGCGNGDFLNNFLKNKKIKKFGVEPSQKTINLCIKKYKNINFVKAFSYNLPFSDNYFDLVNVWSVLHWVDRNYYLQSLGELIRVTDKYLAIMDFYPKNEHKTKYKHKKGFFTFKTNFDKILNNSGYLEKIFEFNYIIDIKTKKKLITTNIRNDNVNQRKIVIYKKKMILPTFRYKIRI